MPLEKLNAYRCLIIDFLTRGQLIFRQLPPNPSQPNNQSPGVCNTALVISLTLFIISANPVLVESTLLLFGLFSYSAFPLLLGLVHQVTQKGR